MSNNRADAVDRLLIGCPFARNCVVEVELLGKPRRSRLDSVT